MTGSSPQKAKQIEFIPLYRIHRGTDNVPKDTELVRLKGGYGLKTACSFGEVTAILPTAEGVRLEAFGLSTAGPLKVRLKRDNVVAETLSVE